jgi:cell division protein DivIC
MAAGTTAKEAGPHRGARRRIRLFMMVLTAFTLWAGFTLWEQSGSIGTKRAQLAELQEKLSVVQAVNDNYKTEVTRLHDSEYIEQRVRKDFGMIRPGDTIFGQ